MGLFDGLVVASGSVELAAGLWRCSWTRPNVPPLLSGELPTLPKTHGPRCHTLSGVNCRSVTIRKPASSCKGEEEKEGASKRLKVSSMATKTSTVRYPGITTQNKEGISLSAVR